MSAERGVFSDVFRTTVQPVASTGASFQAIMRRGKFHGMIWPTTPTGSRLVNTKKPVFSTGTVLPVILSACPA